MSITKDGGLDETVEIPHPGIYDCYDANWPSIQRLYDIGTVMNNEEPMIIDSVQITKKCMKELKYKTVLQSLNEKNNN